MAGTERQLWKWLARNVIPAGHFCRVESGETSPGIPDVYYRLSRGSAGWLELKGDRKPQSVIPFSKGGIRLDQERWIRDEIRRSGMVWIVVRLEEPSKRVLWIHGRFASRVNAATRKELQLMATEQIGLPLNRARLPGVRDRVRQLLRM